MGYKIARFLINILVRLLTRLEITGLEYLPPSGSYIVVANHIGRLEVAVVYYVLDRPDIIMLVAEKYKENALFRWFVKRLDGIYIDRFNADLVALRETLNRLQKGGVLVMAPEGTRSPTGALMEGRAGASYLAAKSGVPVIPVGVTGTRDREVVFNFKHLRRTKVVATIGAPFTLPPLKGKGREEQLKGYTDEIMCRIAALLPEGNRGVYAEHPRLMELLNK
jgi:1-acyl-sn-glycerol-3-phosphate acyltransferase